MPSWEKEAVKLDKIFLNKLAFYGYHGVFPEENKLGQRYYVDLALELDLQPAGKSDDINHSIDYGQVYEVTKTILEGPPYRLIESAAERVAGELLNAFPLLQACRVKVVKPDPPIPGHYESVAVEIYRER